MLILRASFGMDVNWGFGSVPPYVAGLTIVVFAFGLSLFGVFEIPAIGGSQAMNASSRKALSAVLHRCLRDAARDTLLGPFLGTTVAMAFTAHPHPVLDLAMVGFGLAFPFLLIAFVPAMYRTSEARGVDGVLQAFVGLHADCDVRVARRCSHQSDRDRPLGLVHVRAGRHRAGLLGLRMMAGPGKQGVKP